MRKKEKIDTGGQVVAFLAKKKKKNHTYGHHKISLGKEDKPNQVCVATSTFFAFIQSKKYFLVLAFI